MSLPGVTRPAAETEQQMVKGIGLTSATTLVMGSMIGSGVFIVSADIARLTDSPALLIGAWVVTGFMTVGGVNQGFVGNSGGFETLVVPGADAVR